MHRPKNTLGGAYAPPTGLIRGPLSCHGMGLEYFLHPKYYKRRIENV